MSGIEATDLRAGYGTQEVLHGLSFAVRSGEVVSILGPNGAGKTTTLLALAGAIESTGSITFEGVTPEGNVADRANAGMAFLPESRAIVRRLTVAENLRLCGADPDVVYNLSPELKALADRRAGLLSGGEQQILSLTQAIAIEPTIVLADELSFGLAPIIVTRMLDLAREAADRGAAVLLVEQFARQALRVSDRGYVLRRGEFVLEGPADDLLSRIDEIEASYLGGAAEE